MLDISSLNTAQTKAVTSTAQSLLIIAGAGSGKTRTLIYRLAWLIEQGISIQNILLLTFTRKASAQMLERASLLINQNLHGMKSGTFHAFAYSILKQYPKFCLRHAKKQEVDPNFPKKSAQMSLIDSTDQNACIAQCKEDKKIAKGDRSFPKSAAIIGLISKSRNKEISIEELLRSEAQQLLPYANDICILADAYQAYKRERGFYDYDDLLFELEALFIEEPQTLEYYQNYYPYIMVDEYQDTNKVQARLLYLLAGQNGHIMAVGDDAQSIYAFRGATVRNILDFPKKFPNTEIIYLEENYRSYQEILNIPNAILAKASEGYKKTLFSQKFASEEINMPVRMYKTLSDVSQAKIARSNIQDLLMHNPANEIAVLFRSGFHAFHLELELTKSGIPFRKVGGIKYVEAAHVKDFLAYARLIHNPQDSLAFARIASFAKGIGAKTSQKLYDLSQRGEGTEFNKQLEKYPDFKEDINFITNIKMALYSDNPVIRIELKDLVNKIFDQVKPHIEANYPEDSPRRLQGLEELLSKASDYTNLEDFLSDLVLDTTEEENSNIPQITLSTVHSAKGLEWDHVLVMDLAEGRFPSHRSLAKDEDFEEERRLLYVATTRARHSLALYVPTSLYNRQHNGCDHAAISPFLHGISNEFYEEYRESFGGSFMQVKSQNPYRDTIAEEKEESFAWQKNTAQAFNHTNREDNEDRGLNALSSSSSTQNNYKKLGYCTHKIFGKGKIIAEIDNDKYKINFQNIGIKTILKDFVTLLDD